MCTRSNSTAHRSNPACTRNARCAHKTPVLLFAQALLTSVAQFAHALRCCCLPHKLSLQVLRVFAGTPHKHNTRRVRVGLLLRVLRVTLHTHITQHVRVPNKRSTSHKHLARTYRALRIVQATHSSPACVTRTSHNYHALRRCYLQLRHNCRAHGVHVTQAFYPSLLSLHKQALPTRCTYPKTIVARVVVALRKHS